MRDPATCSRADHRECLTLPERDRHLMTYGAEEHWFLRIVSDRRIEQPALLHDPTSESASQHLRRTKSGDSTMATIAFPETFCTTGSGPVLASSSTQRRCFHPHAVIVNPISASFNGPRAEHPVPGASARAIGVIAAPGASLRGLSAPRHAGDSAMAFDLPSPVSIPGLFRGRV